MPAAKLGETARHSRIFTPFQARAFGVVDVFDPYLGPLARIPHGPQLEHPQRGTPPPDAFVRDPGGPARLPRDREAADYQQRKRSGKQHHGRGTLERGHDLPANISLFSGLTENLCRTQRPAPRFMVTRLSESRWTAV